MRVEVLEKFERIVGEGKRGGQIIRQIRELVAKGEFKVGPVDRVVITVLNFLEPKAGQRQVDRAPTTCCRTSVGSS